MNTARDAQNDDKQQLVGLSEVLLASSHKQEPRKCIGYTMRVIKYIHPRDDPEFELYNQLVPECGGVSVSYWFSRADQCN